MLDAFDQTRYKFRHNGIVRPAFGNERPGFALSTSASCAFTLHRRKAEGCASGRSKEPDAGVWSPLLLFPANFPVTREFVALLDHEVQTVTAHAICRARTYSSFQNATDAEIIFSRGTRAECAMMPPNDARH